MPVNTELVARLLQPINADAPSGADLRYDARVDAIKEARREDLDLPGVVNRKLADWPTVIAGTSQLLAEETKDLQLAAWLTEALLQRDYNLLLGVFFCTSVMVILFNLLTDLAYAAIDPRIEVAG